MPAHQLHYQCLPWRVHPHRVSNTQTHLSWTSDVQVTEPDWPEAASLCCIIHPSFFFTNLIFAFLLLASTTTLPMWWLMGNQSTWACGIQQDRRTTTDSGHSPTHRQYVYTFAFAHTHTHTHTRSNNCLPLSAALHRPVSARQCWPECCFHVDLELFTGLDVLGPSLCTQQRRALYPQYLYTAWRTAEGSERELLFGLFVPWPTNWSLCQRLAGSWEWESVCILPARPGQSYICESFWFN